MYVCILLYTYNHTNLRVYRRSVQPINPYLCMYICIERIHIYIYIYKYTYVLIYTHVHIYTHTCMYIYIYIYIYRNIHTHVYCYIYIITWTCDAPATVGHLLQNRPTHSSFSYKGNTTISGAYNLAITLLPRQHTATYCSPLQHSHKS